MDVTEERRELTLLERREDMDARLARGPVFLPDATLPRVALCRRLTEARARGETGLALGLADAGRSTCGTTASSLRFPFVSSLNHILNVDNKLPRLRCLLPAAEIFGSALSVSPGDSARELGGDCCAFAITQGEPT